jgi:chromodomain-helicase-DNA-binding protein 4
VKAKKRIRRGPVFRPAYGIFRSAADLEFDAYEEDTELLPVHQDICEKCHKARVRMQLEKSKKARRKACKEDESESEDDKDLIRSLGD